ncbi:MAG: hypothetical protein K9L68_00810, partial [Spirochaetales bacterium]|nr:hypothetical protein [Spirochaetales bacterium]MCF7937115.1 hypothetical protein [Spirochaetales bacterium]
MILLKVQPLEKKGGRHCSLSLLGKRERRKRSGNLKNRKKVANLRISLKYDGEFDPGSERTLAARFKHA